MIPSGIGASSLVIMRVLSRLMLEVADVGVGLGEGFRALLQTTLAHVCWRGAGVVAAGPGFAPGGGDGGVGVVWIWRSEVFSSSATLVMRVTAFCSRAGLL